MSQTDHSLVLVVDDEAIILWGTASLLESMGYRVVRANSGAAALEALRGDPGIDILLTDFQMPHMSGIELSEAAHRLRPNLPVIVATGNASLQHRGTASAMIAKPFTRDELAEAMRIAVLAKRADRADSAD